MDLWSNTAVFKWNVLLFFFLSNLDALTDLSDYRKGFFYMSLICTNFTLEEFLVIMPQLKLESGTNILESHKTITHAQVVSLHTVDTQKA